MEKRISDGEYTDSEYKLSCTHSLRCDVRTCDSQCTRSLAPLVDPCQLCGQQCGLQAGQAVNNANAQINANFPHSTTNIIMQAEYSKPTSIDAVASVYAGVVEAVDLFVC